MKQLATEIQNRLDSFGGDRLKSSRYWFVKQGLFEPLLQTFELWNYSHNDWELFNNVLQITISVVHAAMEILDILLRLLQTTKIIHNIDQATESNDSFNNDERVYDHFNALGLHLHWLNNNVENDTMFKGHVYSLLLYRIMKCQDVINQCKQCKKQCWNMIEYVLQHQSAGIVPFRLCSLFFLSFSLYFYFIYY